MNRRATWVALAGMAATAIACGAADRAATPDPAALERGRALYEQWSCSMCHGTDRRGTDSAPEIVGLAEHWNADTLTRYIRDPETYRSTDARLGEIAARYPVVMPEFPEPEEDRRALATWLLAAEPTEKASAVER